MLAKAADDVNEHEASTYYHRYKRHGERAFLEVKYILLEIFYPLAAFPNQDAWGPVDSFTKGIDQRLNAVLLYWQCGSRMMRYRLCHWNKFDLH